MDREEALKKVRQMSLPKETMEILEALAPELAESEDERIRKALIKLMTVAGESYVMSATGFKKERLLAYLEKQKEQKPAEWSDTKELVFQDICKHLQEEGYSGLVLLLNALRNGEFQPKQEWSEEDEKMLKWLCRIIHSRVVNKELSLAEESDLGKWIDKWINYEPQPVQKWDEFDEDCLKRAIWYVENPAPSVVKDTNLVLWLQSLSERFNLQSKQEWSDEDEHRMDGIIQWLREYQEKFNPKYDSLSIESIESLIDWLKSIRPQYHGDVTMTEAYKMGLEAGKAYHWKPSKEQMDALDKAIPVCMGVVGRDEIMPLESLYEQLKKL